MAYTAEQIVIKGIPVEQLTELCISCNPGEHGSLKFSAYLPEDKGEETLFGLTENDSVTVYVENGKPVFSGILTEVSTSSEGNMVKITANARSRSILMDQKRRSRTFQDINMTYGQLFRIILSEYPGSDIRLTIEDKPIGEIAVQYQETDWEFLKRMLSMLNAVLACRCQSEAIKLYGGVPDIPWGKWDYEKTGFTKEMGEYSDWTQRGKAVNDNDFLIMQIEADHLPELFEQVEDKGRTFVVRQYTCQLVRGMLLCCMELQKKTGVLAKTKYPMHIIGTALQGTVLAISGTQIKVHLDIDGSSGAGDVYWFPFSTLSASPDGSGWYYMPEKGDKIRVYFASKYTKDVIAVSAVSSYDGKSGGVPDRMGDSSSKYLGNPQGQEMKLGADGIYLSSNKGASAVKIGNGGDITLSAKGTINIEAAENLDITAEEAISLQALEQAVITCSKGGMIQMPEDGNVYIQGTEVKVN